MTHRDFIRDLGYLAIASRLKRLSERLLRGGSLVYDSVGVDFEPRWFPVFHLLHSSAVPMSITDIAGALQLTHPAIIQSTRIMTRKGLLRSSGDSRDGRRRLLALTEKGKRLARQVEPVWRDFDEVVTEFFESREAHMMDILQKVEAGLDEEEMGRRVLRRIKQRQLDAVQVVDYRPEHRKAFKVLNEEWLKEFFTIEASDHRVLSNPEAEIVGKGGHILIALLDNHVIGTTALIRIDHETYELAKMAVASPYRGRQAGRKLAVAAIEKTTALGAKTLLLKTDPRLKAAVSLYRSLGFARTAPESLPAGRYQRERTGFVMTLDVTKP